MATMNISLPDQMKAWVESRSEDGRYSNASDYVRDLIRRDQQRADAVKKLQEVVDDALASGVSKLTPDELREHSRRHADKVMKEHGLADDRIS